MESAASAAQLEQQQQQQQQLENPFLPQATVYAIGAAEKENEQEQKEENDGEEGEEGEEGADEKDGVCGVNDGAELLLDRQSPPPADRAADEHSHCSELVEAAPSPPPATATTAQQQQLAPVGDEAVVERGVFITALAPSAMDAVVAVAAGQDRAAENHNTLGTIVGDHGAATTTCNGAQQIVYIRGDTQTPVPELVTSVTPLVHGSNVVRIQIVPADPVPQEQNREEVEEEEEKEREESEDCNNNSVRGSCVSVQPNQCQSAQVTVVSVGARNECVTTVPEQPPLPAPVTVTFEERAVLSVPSPEPSAGTMVQNKKLLGSTGEPTELDSSAYVYYMAAMAARDGGPRTTSSSGASSSSGQCSPSDMLDSGTCSDIELTPPPLPKKMSQILRASAAIKKSMAVNNNNSNEDDDHDHSNGIHQARVVTPPATTPPPPPAKAATVAVLRQFSPIDNGTDNGVINQPVGQHQQHHIEFQRLSTTHRHATEERNRQNEQQQNGKHQTSDSFGVSRQHGGVLIATDSDGSESCLSCDSLNFEHLQPSLQQPLAVAKEQGDIGVPELVVEGEKAPIRPPKLPPYVGSSVVCSLPDSLLAAIRGSRPKVYCTDEEEEEEDDPVDGDPAHRKVGFVPADRITGQQHVGVGGLDLNSLACAAAAVANGTTTTTRSILMDKINSLESGRHQQRNDQPRSDDDATSNYLLMHHTINDPAGVIRAQSSCSAGSLTTDSVRSNQFESDRYYKFHINERGTPPRPDGEQHQHHPGTVPGSPETTPSVVDDDESFAGLKDLSNGTSTIRSNKGTVRGVKNRVRNGIATFLQMQQTSLKNYKDKEAGKVVVYSTSMGIVRETYTKCMNVKQILRTLLVKFEEKDIFMSNEYQQEIKERMQADTINIPQVFVDGQHIGDAECIERLNESGELRKMLKPYKCLESPYMCKVCGGYRLLPCPSCGGSKKSIHRNHFTAEFVALKCMNCDEVGLVKCHNC